MAEREEFESIKDQRSGDLTILKWSALAEYFNEVKPLRFAIKISDALPSQEYNGYQIKGFAYIYEDDSTEHNPFPPKIVTEVSFFTTTSMESRFKNLHGDSWATEIVGRKFFFTYQGKVKSDKGREMHSCIVMPPQSDSKLVVAQDTFE